MEVIPHLVIILIAIRQVLAAGGYNDSCSEIRYWDPDSIYGRKFQASPYIVARCTDSAKKDRCSWLPLTVCFANDGGVFGYRKNGNFAKTCHDCQYDKKTTDFFCLCPEKGEGQYSFPRVLLNDYVRNENGLIWCHNVYGFEVKCNDFEFMKIRMESL